MREELAQYSGKVIRTSLSPDQEQKLRQAIEQAGVGLPGSAAPGD